MGIKGVIFDMDGLMVDTEKHYNRYLVKSANELGFPMKEEDALLLRSLDKKLAGPLMQKIFGAEYDHGKVLERYYPYVEEYFKTNDPEVKPGLYKLLDYLQEAGYQRAVATATNMKRAEDFLTRIGVINRFECIYSGRALANSKPAPDIYLMAAGELGLRPQECIALEDSPNGVKSAASAGCKVVMIPDLSEPDEELSGLLYEKAENLEEVIEILKREKHALG